MELKVTGRNLTISERFRDYVEEKSGKVEQLADKPLAFEVKVTSRDHAQKSENAITVELTIRCKGPVVRSESHAADKFAAFDTAYNKLLERLRRARDKKKVHHGRHTPKGVAEATADLPIDLGESLIDLAQENNGEVHDSPVEIRRKIFEAVPMSVDDAVDNMELVGHDFYLFVDEDTSITSVVYRRKGWSYGVLSLDKEHAGEETVLNYRNGERQSHPNSAAAN